MGGLMEKIIPRNSPIPAIREQIFTTNENGQTSIKIKILQGEREITSANNTLDEFVLSGLEPKPAGIPRIKVRFSLDVDGILFVSAIDESSGNENNLVIKTNEQLSIQEMRELVSSSIQNAKKDIDLRLLIETKIKATKLINEINNVKPMFRAFSNLSIFRTLPKSSGSSRCNCNSSFLLLLHPIHSSSTIMNFTNFVRFTCVI